MKPFLLILASSLFFFLTSCDEHSPVAPVDEGPAARTVMEAHLAAIAAKDLPSLRTTLSPRGDMKLILPAEEIEEGTKAFIDFHEAWFSDTTWSFETKILDLQAGESLANAVTELVYREPERDGKPYFNRMIVTYLLRKIDGQWFVVQDHASSAEKSTDVVAQ